MSPADTRLALCEHREWFNTTHWSVVLAARDGDSPQGRQALEQLCHTYWYPLYAFVRRKGYDMPEAQDLTQEFFARLLSRNFPARIKPEGGKFRSYLLSALQHFLVNEWQSRQTQKRGGGRRILSLDEADAEDRYRLERTINETPESLFDRRWASILLEKVRRHLRDEYAADGKADVFDQLQSCLTGSELSLPYTELAAQRNCSQSAVKMAVHRMRKRYGQLLRQEISQTVATPEDVEEEIRALLAAI